MSSNDDRSRTSPEAILLARWFCGLPVRVDEMPESLASVVREASGGDGQRLDLFRAACRAHGIDSEAWVEAAGKADPNATPAEEVPLDLLAADEILTTQFPEPVWAVPNLLPVGLGILAGAPKVGKSWLGLQLALAVASGGTALGQRVKPRPVLYLALEDPPRRLQERMRRQAWTLGLPAHFMPLGNFEDQLHDLTRGGAERLARQIQRAAYGLVVVDTLSRAIPGDQLDVQEMTRGLKPLQEMAHAQNCAVLLIDHHRKGSGQEPDAIADILGSTAKGAMADTAWGLYREPGKMEARLAITGREVAEHTLLLKMDWHRGCWQVEGDVPQMPMTERRREILEVLRHLGRAPLRQIAEATGQDKGNTYRRLRDLVTAGIVKAEGDRYSIPELPTTLTTPTIPTTATTGVCRPN